MDLVYLKSLIISPGLGICSESFFGKRLIFRGAYYLREFCDSK